MTTTSLGSKVLASAASPFICRWIFPFTEKTSRLAYFLTGSEINYWGSKTQPSLYQDPYEKKLPFKNREFKSLTNFFTSFAGMIGSIPALSPIFFLEMLCVFLKSFIELILIVPIYSFFAWISKKKHSPTTLSLPTDPHGPIVQFHPISYHYDKTYAKNAIASLSQLPKESSPTFQLQVNLTNLLLEAAFSSTLYETERKTSLIKTIETELSSYFSRWSIELQGPDRSHVLTRINQLLIFAQSQNLTINSQLITDYETLTTQADSIPISHHKKISSAKILAFICNDNSSVDKNHPLLRKTTLPLDLATAPYPKAPHKSSTLWKEAP